MNKVAKIENNALTAPTTPAQLLAIAVDQGADLDRLEKLMELQQRWEATEARKAYINAMTAFRSSVGNISKDKAGHNSRYASLAHTLNSIKDQLSDNGLTHTWKTEQHDNQLITVTCCVTHQMGHQECTSMSANPDSSGSKNSIQALGSTVSYLQRYTLFAILGLASTDQDDDANSVNTAPIDEHQLANLEALYDEIKDLMGDDFDAYEQKFNKHFGIEKLSDLHANQIKGAMTTLEGRRKTL